MGRDRVGEVRRKEESFTTLQSDHLLSHSEANNGQAGVGFFVNKKWKDNVTRVSFWEFQSSSTRPTQNRQIPTEDRSSICATTSHSDEETNNFYNIIDNILEKRTHYTIVMDDFNAKVGGQIHTSERTTYCFCLGQRNEREGATTHYFKIMNTQFQKKAGRRWTWTRPDGNTKNEIDYIMTDKPSMVTDVTVINRVNIGSNHRMVIGSIKYQIGKLLNKNTRKRVDTQIIRRKKNMLLLELKKTGSKH